MIATLLRRLAVIGALAAPLLSLGQTGTVRGFVYDESTGEPSIFTPVSLVGAEQRGAQTDVNGYFSISKVPPGAYTLRVVYLGFDTLQKAIQVKADQIVTEKLYLRKGSIQMQAVEVTAEQQKAQENVRVGVTKLTPKQIERLPAIGGQADLAQYMQVVPGVVFTGDQGGQLYIRGGSPVMNKVIMDGMTLYNPFHSIGLFSVFDNDIIRNADILTAGFNAEYGGRISSVMDITTRDGNKTRLAGKVAASTFAAKALLEGPLKKQTEQSAGSSSFLLNFKHSYLDQTSKSMYQYADTAGLPFSFTDLYGKISINAANGSKVNFFGFNFSDEARFRGVSNVGWDNWGAGTNFVLVPSGSAVLIEGTFALSNYSIELLEGDLPPRSSSINNFNGGLNFKYFTGKDEINYGIEVTGVNTGLSYFNSLGYNLQVDKVSTEMAGFINYKARLGKWVLDPGIRLQYYATLAVLNPEPRLGFKLNVTDRFRVKGAAGLYSQNLIATNNDRDVVNLFYGFITAPEDIPKTMTMPNGDVRDIDDPLQRASHVVGGFEYDLTPKTNINIEGYYKKFGQVTNINRDKLYNDTPEFVDKPDELKKDFIVESGDAYGADLLVKYENKGLYLWAVYSLNFVNRFDGKQEYSPIWDRRHNVNLVASYTFGKHDSWSVNARWNYGSGFPFTQNQGFYERQRFGDGIYTDIYTNNGELAIIYGPLNAGRLTDYHRLDLGATKTWKLDERQVVQLDLSVTNVYDRKNIFYRDRVSAKEVYQLPLLPSIGFTYSF
ncbi:MAG: carboxypeptidase-like regulatory domain-containing protein [Flavobacteriales bacterium]|nr:carboxypeptidase-like regulatory domain-containing protein [Flavobacteriales bacterium]MEB2341665.1 carboxypeptidase-like regulatory domain-containing protein [Flavobacteriia bacterium]